jgi:hypothetical protein
VAKVAEKVLAKEGEEAIAKTVIKTFVGNRSNGIY